MAMSEQWNTDEKIDAAYDYFVSRVPNFEEPYAHAVGVMVNSRMRFPCVNVQEHLLPAVIVASACDYSPDKPTIDISANQLRTALERLLPAESHPHLVHANLAAWRHLLTDYRAQEDSFVAVFLYHADDPLPHLVNDSFRSGIATRIKEKVSQA